MTAPVTRLICAPWVSLVDLPSSKPALDDDTWDDLLWQASEMLYLWSGKQYSGGCSSTVVFEQPPGGADDSIMWRYLEDTWADWGYWSPWGVQGVRGIGAKVVALLPDAPITEITAVTDADANPVDYLAELPAGVIRRQDGKPWGAGTTISYTHGIAPPIGGKRAAILLTTELAKSWTGAKCNLPKRIENVTRQGLSVSMATTEWGTGIWDIDSWLRSVNPRGLMRRASAWSPDAARLRRATP
jgi:hypothetical protein